MSDSETDNNPPFGPNSRRKTWGTGAEPVPALKRTLRDLIRNEVILPKGTYDYKKLESVDEIRVLRILKGRRDDKIECNLLRSALASSGNGPSSSTAETLEYDALSYWWGPPNEEARKEIMITSYDGQARDRNSSPSLFKLQRGSFYIRPNLEAALRQIRSKKRDVDIWVDAICINQDNKKEKMAQVSRMHEIYSEAKNVCVWLGAGVPDTKETFDFLKETLNLQRLDKLIASGENPEKWWLVVRLMENRWFSRRWVIQELALARDATVRWGKAKMSWTNFADAIALFMTKHDEIKQILSKTAEYPRTTDPFGDARALGANTLVNATNDLFRKSEDGKIQQRLLTLEVLVSCLFLAFEATDPRDTIYAVLSIAKDTSFAMSDLKARTSWEIKTRRESNGIYGEFDIAVPAPPSAGMQLRDDIRISPDYDKNIIDVCADFMDYCIETSQSLDILCRHWAPTPHKKTRRETIKPGAEFVEEETMPTWIPSIKGYAFGAPEDALNGRMNGDSFVARQERQHQQHYNASAGLLPWWEFGKCEQPDSKTAEELEAQSQVSAEAVAQSAQGEASTITPQPPPQRSRKFDGTLSIKGFRLGKITRRSSRGSRGMIQQEAFKMGGLSMDSDHRKVPDQFWRTLVADRGPNGTNAPSWYRRACLECLNHIDQNGDLFTNDLKSLKGTPITIVSFLERVQRVVWNRRFFQSTDYEKKDRKPLFGLVPPEAKLEDIICIIFGCTVPVVLRECNTSDDYYFEFVGECYVHGFMDGEAISKNRPCYPYNTAEEFKLR
jgi:hypothetical protein